MQGDNDQEYSGPSAQRVRNTRAPDWIWSLVITVAGLDGLGDHENKRLSLLVS